MNIEELKSLLKPVTELVSASIIDQNLEASLNAEFPPESATFTSVEDACHAAISEGWMCSEGSAGRRFGRVVEPTKETGMLSIDVVELANIIGPHHRHPSGEICMVMPVSDDALFDGKGRGWCVYEPGSSHRPTVTNGKALVLYMLPHGKIEFTGN